MRCHAVNDWRTRRGPWHGEGTRVKTAAQEEGDDDDDVLLQKQESKRTYATSYDCGFVFEQLWKKKVVDEHGNRIQPEPCPEVRVPDTVVYKGGFPANWFFHSKIDGKLLKKKPESLYIPHIFEAFGAENGTCRDQVVASYIGTVQTDVGPVNNILYFDRKRLKDFLFGENSLKEGFLQRFVAPTEVPFDSSARNTTIHATWSPYNCLVEQRTNTSKLDDKRVATSAKVNVTSGRVETIPISAHTKLHKQISRKCRVMAEHMTVTSPDHTEVTSMTCYFKVGEKNKLWLLWCSSISVNPKFQDAFGYIPSIRTFTGRHSPVVNCPEHIGAIEKATSNAGPSSDKNGCALCSAKGPQSSAFGVMFRMLGLYVRRERQRMVASRMAPLAATALESRPQSTVSDSTRGAAAGTAMRTIKLSQVEEIDVRNKAAAIFSLLDIDYDGKIQKVELWSGMMDLGYTNEEIAAIMGEAPPPEEEAHKPFLYGEFQDGLWKMVQVLSPERLTRFMQTVDLMGSGDWDQGGQECAKEDAAQMTVEQKAEKAMKKYTSSKRIPRLLSKLQHTMDASELKRISLLDEHTRADDEFANRKVWVCKECAVKFNSNARGVFDFKTIVEEQDRGKRIAAKMRMLRDLQLNTSPFLAHSYPVGEIPALCTPRMYEALHEHTARRPTVNVPQVCAPFP